MDLVAVVRTSLSTPVPQVLGSRAKLCVCVYTKLYDGGALDGVSNMFM